MAVTVVPKNYTLIDDCEAVGTWDGETPAVVDDFFKEGAACLGFTVRGTGNQDTWRTGNWDLSGVKHLRWWFMTVALKELNWVQLYLSDGVDTGYYDVLAIADYPGGWYNIVIDLSRAVDAGTKPNMAAITTIGFRYNNSAIGKNAQNTWIDHLCLCDGLVAYGAPVFDFDDILAEDEALANGWGIIRKIGGVYYLVGSIEFGDSASISDLEFKDVSQVVVFEDRKVNASLYSLTVVGNETATIQKFQLGDQADTAGVSGCLVRTQSLTQAAKFALVCTDVNVPDFKLYGSNFLDANGISLPPAGASREVVGCSFEKCGQVVPDTCKVQYCNFISSDADAVLINDDPHYVTDCNFISCVNAIEIDTPGDGTYEFDNLKFIGNDYDVNNTSGSALTITKANGSDPSTYTGTTVTFVASIQLTMVVKDGLGDPVVGAFAYIDDVDESPYILNTVTDEGGIATTPYVGDVIPGSRWRVRKYGYKNFKQLIDIGSVDISLPITLIADPQQT